ncbi:MAG: ribosome recycling factor [Candidatus Firestonebacteria bacterium RIFOXYC2_FULL_39_67]|nr:MAG: ribosome recycling factor [Candidatus Firestonebacteria bacterium RIFOXYD2_FULL_39_29]OGF55227.1 MAG: ribosome recycling factor [Candidatus Firestonebacteria bacterium RifOxyC12_full_39_7]OGF57602.1 MAG: ribosome recycling factor [Candidatus Firestonebacteria bacterium RIFOXYC2_FULL_39_67]
MAFNFALYEDKLKKGVDHLRKELSTIRTGRANASILDNVKVEYYGSMVPISQVAAVNVPQAKTIEIKAWDSSALPAIEKAIQKSDLGLNPVNDGKLIRINIPALTEERRKELVKYAKKVSEEEKVALRNNRRTANEEVDTNKTKGEISEDQQKKDKEKIQKTLDSYIAQIDKILADKEKEMMEV